MNTRGFHRNRRPSQRGSALLLALFFLMLLYLIAVALFRLLPAELHSVGRSRLDMQAHYACNAGVKHAAGWLEAAISSGTNSISDPTTIPPYEPFEMPAGPNKAYHNPDGYNGNAKFQDLGRDFDDLLFAEKPYLEIIDDLGIDVDNNGTADWFVKVFIFPDRQTYPIPVHRTDLTSDPQNGLRFYTIVAEASPFRPDNPRMRTRVTMGQRSLGDYARFIDEWPGDHTPNNLADDERYSAQQNVTTVDGPFHTNSFFRIEPRPGYFSGGAAPVRPSFSDRMTYHKDRPDATAGWDSANWIDKIAYWQGNYGSFSNNNLPWDNSGADKPNAYERLMGQKTKLKRSTSAVELPRSAIDLQKAAWGFGTTINPQPGIEGGAEGAFIRASGSAAQGGVYVRGDVADMALGVVNATGALATATSATNAVGNPGMLIKQSAALTAPLATPITTVTPANVVTPTVTGVPGTQTIRTTHTTGSQTVNVTNVQAIRTTTGTQTNVTVQTIRTPITSVTTSVIGGTGLGQGVTVNVTITTGTQTTFSNVTRTTPIVQTTYQTNVTPQVQPVTSVQTTYQPTVNLVTNLITTTVNVTNVQTQTTYQPVDRVFEVKTMNLTIGATYGGKQVVNEAGVPLSGPVVIPTGNIALLKDSRVNGDQLVLKSLSGNLNGMVYSEGNIDNLHGVNKGRRTIATDLGKAGNPDNLPEAENGKRVTIGNPTPGSRGDLLQWGISPNAPSPSGDNVLGIVGHKVGFNIRSQDLQNLYQSNPMQIHAIILAGRYGDEDLSDNDQDSHTPLAQSRKGGFTIFNMTENFNGVTRLTQGTARNGSFRLKGGLIERLGGRTWMVQGNETNIRGWNSGHSFDLWAARMPPPFFPTANQLSPMTMSTQMLGTGYGGFSAGSDH